MNNKGFSMVELLATVAILGILSGLAITAVSRILDKAHEEYYKSEEKNLILAAQTYYNANKTELPKIIGKKSEKTIKELKSSGYLKKDITSYDGKTNCDPDKSKVRVYKYGVSDYSYSSVLSCGDKYTTTSSSERIGSGPYAEVSWPNGKNEVSIAYMDLTIKGEEDDSNVNLVSYSYKILVYDEAKNINKELVNSGNKAYRGATLNKRVDLTKYTISGKARVLVKVTATNMKGDTASFVFPRNFKDDDPPKCVLRDDGKDTPDTETGKKDWTSTTRKITIECEDEKGSGCEKKQYTKTFTKDNIVDYITIKDNAGNSKKCYVTTYIDKTKPVIEATAYKCDNKGEASGNAVATIEATADKEWSSSSFNDNVNGWLNNTNYPNGVCFVFKVTDNLALKDKSWKWNTANLPKNANNYKSLTGGPSSDNNINANQYITDNFKTSKTYTHSLTAEGHRYAEFNVVDDKGNSTTLKLDIKIDRTAPSKPSTVLRKWKDNGVKPDSIDKAKALTVGYNSGDWTGKKICTYPSDVTDSISGGVYYRYTTTGKTENNADAKAAYRNIAAEGTSYIKWKSIDEAGNTLGYNENITAKLDLSAPTCDPDKEVDHSHNGVTVSFSCSDSLSGVKSCHGKESGLKTDGAGSKTYTYAIYDRVENKGTCSVKITKYNQHNLRTCGTCDRCSDAACEDWNYVTKHSCSYSTRTASTCYGSSNNGSEYFPVEPSHCGHSVNTDASMCCCHASYWQEKSTCNRRKRDCSKCGCSSWNDWKGWQDDAYSCNSYCDTKTRDAYK